jgi:undecaprenyl pyrophosphate phosphatase UppP
MDWLHVVILGVIEGLTEFQPISSTVRTGQAGTPWG